MKYKKYKKLRRRLKKFQRGLIKNETFYEKEFEKRLLVTGLYFHKQFILGRYIVDFVLPNKMVIVELDGKHHEESKYRIYDHQRTQFLEGCGFSVLRISNVSLSGYNVASLYDLPSYEIDTWKEAIKKANDHSTIPVRKWPKKRKKESGYVSGSTVKSYTLPPEYLEKFLKTTPHTRIGQR